MNAINAKNARTAVSLVGTFLAGRTALARVKQAHSDNDRLELLDAAINTLAVVTGILVIVRRLREGKEA